MSIFIESRKRLRRAVLHAEAFKSIWKSVIDPKAYETAIEMNGDWTEGVVRYVRNTPVPENDLAFEFGEMFYQLRAALDHLVYKATVLKHGSEPPPHENTVAFPICPDDEAFNRNPVNKPPFPKQLAVWLENIQTYNVRKHRGTETEFFIRALTILHDCARKDRHRRLHIVAAIPTQVEFVFDAWPGRVVSFHPLPMNLLEGKDQLMRITCIDFTPEKRNGRLKLNSDVLIEIGTDEIPINQPRDSERILQAVFESVDRCIAHFEEFFK